MNSSNLIHPGLIWPDQRGKHIQAHGGGIFKQGDTWFWFGEDRSKENDPDKRYVACYASKNLVNWEFRNQVLAISDPENFGPEWVLERPKVFYSKKTGKYVMYVHIDGRITPDHWSRYSIASLGIATCDTIDGNYQYQRHFRPLGLESRDIGQFIDDDGTSYLIFESRPTQGFYIAALSEDCLDVEREVAFIKAPLEGGSIVHYEGLYYAIGSALTGWWPNANKYATAERLEGPWSEFKDFAPPESHTFMSQSTNLIKITGTEKTTVIYAGDRWRPEEQWDSRYLWMPVEIGGGNFKLPEPMPWSIDVVTGQVTVQK